MKRVIFFSIWFLIFGCANYNGFKVSQEGRNCFQDKDLEQLIISQSFSDTKPTHLFIHPIVVGDKKCVGLFGFTFKNLTVTWKVVQKVLKFEDKIYVYDSNNPKANETAVNEFKDKYQKNFAEEDMDKLIESFLKGTESNTRYY